MTDPSLMEIREAHYERFLGPLADPVLHSTDEQPVHIDMYRFAPSDELPWWTLITGGMSDRRQHLPEGFEGTPPRTELMMQVREPKDWMFKELKFLAELPFHQETFVHWGHTVDNEKPITDEPSALTAVLFLPPFFAPEHFDSLVIEDDGVDILWVMPITDAERAYAVEHGSKALQKLMEEAELDPVVDEQRESLV